MSILVICGVSGCGKSTIGRALADQFECEFIEGDDHHPPENIAKMSAGNSLTDADRTSWLVNISKRLENIVAPQTILACSALTPHVQDFLIGRFGDQIIWIKLEISRELAAERMAKREHFMPSSLLDSQFEAWSPPASGLDVSAAIPVNEIVLQIATYLEANPIQQDS